jgi:L-ascorbate metabolism protein UlaG (beta-lactamase superfamily)
LSAFEQGGDKVMDTYIVTVDWYNDFDGHNLEIICCTTDYDEAKEAFDTYVSDHRSIDRENGYKIADDYENRYHSYGTMPDYHRVILNTYTKEN